MTNFQANFRLTPWLMAAVVSATLVACGGGGQDTILGTGDIANVLVAPPTVTVVSPLRGALNVAPNTTLITAAFSEPMDATTINNNSFTLVCPQTLAASGGTVTYLAATKVATLSVPATLLPGTCTATVTSAVKDSTGVNMVSNYPWQFTVGDASASDTTPPTVAPVTPTIDAIYVPTNTVVKALFNEAMNPLTINTDSFTLSSVQGGLVEGVEGKVTLGPLNKNATFTPNANLTVDTVYTATITMASTDLAGNALVEDVTWNFTTADVDTVTTGIDLDTAAPFGTFGGTAGMTNMGTLTVINGDIGTIATATDSITGFHDASNIYTEVVLANVGNVTGKIYTCTNSTTGTNSAGPSAPDCAVATQARLDAQTAYLALAGMPVVGTSPAPGANLASVTLLPGTYKAPSGSFLIEGGDLTLDAQGDANATWVFQMASTLTVGGPGAAAPQSIILAGEAQAKNVFWQVGSAATINAAGGGTMVGTIIAQDGVTFSTDGNNAPELIVTLNGRALSLGASVTMVNTVINVPAQ
jgi:hypothetical protein